jgi:nicotinamidase-related amidase
MKVHLVIIDPQNSFCNPSGELFVPGANEDCERLSTMINRLEDKIDSIHVTLDSHQEVDIAHPVFWVDENGNNPAPFTIISVDDVVSGKWLPSSGNLEDEAKATFYVGSLKKNGRYPLCIWPPHCIVGSQGHQIEDNVSNAIRQWSKTQFKLVNFIQKGANPWTEHYSAIKADVPDPLDPSTLMNTDFLNEIVDSDVILIAGQALSHCVANTVTDMIENGVDPKKIVLLTDTCSNVPGFEEKGEVFIKKLENLGASLMKSDEIELNLVGA